MSDSGTPTTGAAPVATPIVVNGGDSPLLFDDMEFSLARPIKASKPKVEKEETKADTESKDKKPAKELTANDEVKETKESGKEKEKEKLAETKDKEAAVQRKTHKAKWDKSEWDLDDEAELTVKVNGQDVPVKLNELMSNYSGKTNWSKKFQDLSVKEKEVLAVDQRLKLANDKLKAVYSEADPQKRIFLMSEMAEMNPMEFRAKYLDENLKMLEKYSVMTDDERKADATAFENAYLKHQMGTRATTDSRNQALQQLQQKVEGLLTSHKITQEEFQKQDQVLEEIFKKQDLDLKQITPEFVIETIEKDKLWFASHSVFESLQHQMSQQDMVSFVDKAFASGLEVEDIPDVIDGLYGKGRAKQIAEQKQKQAQEFKTGVNPSNVKPKPQDDGIWSFEQIIN